MFELRQYQSTAIHDLRQSILGGCRRILLTAPTGSGKTVIAAQIVKGAADKGSMVIFFAHRRELVNQCADKLLKFGVEHGVIMSGEEPYGAVDVQVASVDTLRARCIKSNKMPIPHADIIIIDEAHRSLAPTYLKIIFELYPKAIVIGLTATPIRSDGKGMGHIYDDMVHCPSISELIRLGHLVPPRTYAPTIPDLTGVPIRRGDYDEKELQEAMDKRGLVGDIVSHWMRLARDRATVVFATGVRHSVHLKEEFQKFDVRAAHVDGNTSIRDRKQVVDDLRSGALQVVCNHGVFTEGFDEPKLSAEIIARPTKNLGLYIQMAGRVLRPCEEINKSDALLIDHSGNVYEHGFVTDDHNWQLDEGRPLKDTNEERQRKFDEAKSITCVACAYVYTGQVRCPKCGNIPQTQGRFVESRAGDLMEVRAEKRRTAKRRTFTMTDKREWYRQLLGYAHDKKKSMGWVAHSYRAKFDVWPNSFNPEADPPKPCVGEVAGFVRHRNIKFARSYMGQRNEQNNKASGQGQMG